MRAHLCLAPGLQLPIAGVEEAVCTCGGARSPVGSCSRLEKAAASPRLEGSKHGRKCKRAFSVHHCCQRNNDAKSRRKLVSSA